MTGDFRIFETKLRLVKRPGNFGKDWIVLEVEVR